ncbi:STEP II SPLICING FACTOR SLU7 domain and N-terminal domain of CBF1 interacting co-repressor CIR containing protein, putative [Babesia bigemina]|uniref:STEP II SPLICING FACTOR SLU7 domain and N-terminal domain of CBF1 interacting co-repressor CIR containing protein, putative n=1 Tax=Babesia bigemina TaxID=5866 RepID=A0A061D793_BABBI|nr:STEP II SPLICING FACTOR SLU7 domain and N-terminal domain of CBF1 interacting co-repressor CIR containing protein, putative [Babesia bigemina]CDR94774.1 STEP II SPLICING FACTOR SLU7 domain and N-terminal domain of CBF1 interacting co-repressor CIR containing protein, putative [Babesia bigemina]|eukprot:XP_012766960.1 STEP II SPLICING FACTOR SLU7 domain and N-terminal domain of CBF1 interacting co-repressor CIR containing protein, putative [Babesia bigemina]
MWMGKIGNKSASFINHKHFHPGNRSNLEKVWLAEEKHKAELKRQKEMREKLAEEIRMTQLKRQLREQEDQRYKEYLLEQRPPSKYQVPAAGSKLDGSEAGLIITKPATEAQPRSRDAASHKLVIRSSYREDVHECGHSSVYGSFYDRATGQWGYRCCGSLKRGAACPLKRRAGSRKGAASDPKDAQQGHTPATDDGNDNSGHEAAAEDDRKSHSGKRELEDDTGSPAERCPAKAAKHKRRGDLSLAEALDKLKKMEALD